jgi:phosphatidylserine decarboxylase
MHVTLGENSSWASYGTLNEVNLGRIFQHILYRQRMGLFRLFDSHNFVNPSTGKIVGYPTIFPAQVLSAPGLII